MSVALSAAPPVGRRSGPARLGRLAVELLPPFAVALLVLPFVIANGKLSPWEPSTIDLQVYVYAVKDMLAGHDIYATQTPFWNLYFIYPPVAAVLMWFLAWGPYVMWQVVWTLGLVWAQQSVLRRWGVNTMLMALVVADLLPDVPAEGSSGLSSAGRWRRIPRGTLIGLAAAIKLTPALFVIFAFLIGRRRMALAAVLSFLGFTAVGAIFQFHQTVEFWGGLSGGRTRTASPLYAGNQSLLGVFFRVADSSRTTTLVGLAVAGLVALLATLVAAYWWRHGQQAFAVGLVGLATCLASPLSWTHHYVWIVPLAVSVARQRPAPHRLPLPRWARLLSGVWVLWVCACLPLAVLPYGGGRERHFTLLQSLVADLGPLLGVILVLGLGCQLVSRSRFVALAPVAAG